MVGKKTFPLERFLHDCLMEYLKLSSSAFGTDLIDTGSRRFKFSVKLPFVLGFSTWSGLYQCSAVCQLSHACCLLGWEWGPPFVCSSLSVWCPLFPSAKFPKLIFHIYGKYEIGWTAPRRGGILFCAFTSWREAVQWDNSICSEPVLMAYPSGSLKNSPPESQHTNSFPGGSCAALWWLVTLGVGRTDSNVNAGGWF